jgi:hypothetical protein
MLTNSSQVQPILTNSNNSTQLKPTNPNQLSNPLRPSQTNSDQLRPAQTHSDQLGPIVTNSVQLCQNLSKSIPTQPFSTPLYPIPTLPRSTSLYLTLPLSSSLYPTLPHSTPLYLTISHSAQLNQTLPYLTQFWPTLSSFHNNQSICVEVCPIIEPKADLKLHTFGQFPNINDGYSSLLCVYRKPHLNVSKSNHYSVLSFKNYWERFPIRRIFVIVKVEK